VGESFVDLTYRGLPLGRRVKLTQIRPSTGYLELPAPMPVGTRIAIATDEGVSIDAVVTQIHEQIGGSDRTPGMLIAPALAPADPAVASWWRERVSLPELEPPPEPRQRPVTVLPRARATAPVPIAPPAEERPVTVEPELLEPLDPLDASAEPPIVDDGKKTIMMQSVDLSALGLEAGASGQLAAAAAAEAGEGDGDGGGEDEGEGDGDGEGDGGGDGDAAAAAPAGTNGDPRGPIVPDDRKKPHGKKRKKRR
jgi:hypothetical protein